MTIGILVTTNKHKDHIIGIVKSSIKNGHKVILFFMDEGCNLITDNDIISLIDKNQLAISLCDYNRKKLGIQDKDISDRVTCGSQYDNALMNKLSDKVIVF